MPSLRASRALVPATILSTLLLAGSVRAGAFGAADGYSFFAFGNINLSNSDAALKVAAGGTGQFSSYSLASTESNSGNNLYIGGALTFANGTITGNANIGGAATVSSTTITGAASIAGNAQFTGGTVDGPLTYGGTLTSISGATYAGGSVHNSLVSPIPANFFSNAQTSLTALSNTLAGTTANGTINHANGQLNFYGNANASIYVFNIMASDLTTGDGSFKWNIDNSAATIIINVSGTSAEIPNHGDAPPNSELTLWNFSNATALTIDGSIDGSVLAPLADVTTNYGQLQGTLIANTISGHIEGENDPFGGTVPTLLVGSIVPEPASLGLLAVGAVSLLGRRKR